MANFLYLQEVPEQSKDAPGGPWQFVGLLSLFDPPRHDSAETIRRALNLGVNVKMITGNFIFDPLKNETFSPCLFLFNFFITKFIFIFISMCKF